MAKLSDDLLKKIRVWAGKIELRFADKEQKRELRIALSEMSVPSVEEFLRVIFRAGGERMISGEFLKPEEVEEIFYKGIGKLRFKSPHDQSIRERTKEVVDKIVRVFVNITSAEGDSLTHEELTEAKNMTSGAVERIAFNEGMPPEIENELKEQLDIEKFIPRNKLPTEVPIIRNFFYWKYGEEKLSLAHKLLEQEGYIFMNAHFNDSFVNQSVVAECRTTLKPDKKYDGYILFFLSAQWRETWRPSSKL